jgi:hypothetical protein
LAWKRSRIGHGNELQATGEHVRTDAPEARDDLTAQERQIAGMARDGCPSPEIGARLFLGPRVVAVAQDLRKGVRHGVADWWRFDERLALVVAKRHAGRRNYGGHPRRESLTTQVFAREIVAAIKRFRTEMMQTVKSPPAGSRHGGRGLTGGLVTLPGPS